MKKGFTLAELLGVLVILAILAIVTFPPIIRRIKTTKEDINSATKSYIYNSAKLYVEDNEDTYKLKSGDTYCITLQTLANKGYLKEMKDVESGEEIELNRVVKLQIGSDSKITYDLVKAKNCVEQIQ